MDDKYAILWRYQDRLIEGVKVTLELSLLGLILAFIIGLLVCGAKLSHKRWLNIFATVYTTILRGIPDLVQLFLFFYGLQKLLLIIRKTEWGQALGLGSLSLNNFTIATITIGVMFGAYMAETFRGAYLAIPKGQIEAAQAYGLSRFQMLRRITLPQMLRYALPGISNNWLVLMKTTALVSLVQVDDLTKVVKEAATSNPVIKSDFALRLGMYMIGAMGYLMLTTISLMVVFALRKRYSRGFEGVRS
ncbi:ABC transporter permease [Suttonella ornithocola]|uniref:Histidine transport system permease protein hisQ n=1 Tax=Suttonella ornithocola TaxID=279832 RepID=A0A380MUU7_9GAMM|nr:ABC transporter permease subunit [Suttonella ornithocola]SUO95964.1 Histidine transport system permease protein hisQ [Suttonella ornithocola]